MKTLGQYDGSLQMFVEETREPDMARLEFLRWLVEHGKLEHKPAGPPRGTYSPTAHLDTEPELDAGLEWAIPS